MKEKQKQFDSNNGNLITLNYINYVLNFADNAHYLIKKCGLSIETAAKMLNVRPSTFRRKLKNYDRFTISELKLLGSILNEQTNLNIFEGHKMVNKND